MSPDMSQSLIKISTFADWYEESLHKYTKKNKKKSMNTEVVNLVCNMFS